MFPNNKTARPTLDANAHLVPDFLKRHHYHFTSEDSAATIYTKTIHASATMQTPMGMFQVNMNPTNLLIRREKIDNSYRLGITHNEQSDVSPAFTEEEFMGKLEEFETKLNSPQ